MDDVGGGFIKKFIVLAVVALASSLCFGGQSQKQATLNIRTTGGSVSNYPYQLKVANGQLTDNADGTMTLVVDSTSTFNVKQIVYFSSGTLASTTSASYSDAGIAITITPLSASSTIYIFASINGATQIAATQTAILDLKILRGAATLVGTVHADACGFGSATSVAESLYCTVSILEKDAPTTTSQTTYKFQFANDSGVGTVYVNAGGISSGFAVEVGP